jgi:MoxR-like ATPase
MTWTPYYRGDGRPGSPELAPPPPWRAFPRRPQPTQYQPPDGMVDAVNAAIHLRRPLLITGPAGSGKSTVIEQIAHETGLGPVLRWHITSRSTLGEALYRYDALGRIQEHSLRGRWFSFHREKDIGDFVQLGPLGTALIPGNRPRALLIDEIDKSDLDLPSDLLDVLERGEFEIPELARYEKPKVEVRTWDVGEKHTVDNGRVRCTQFPVIVMTSNGERDFPPAFLRRCIRYSPPPLDGKTLGDIVAAHLKDVQQADAAKLVAAFVERLKEGEHLAVDQLLNAVHLLGARPDSPQRTALEKLLLQDLGRG